MTANAHAAPDRSARTARHLRLVAANPGTRTAPPAAGLRRPLLTAAEEVDLAQRIEVGLMAEHRLTRGQGGGAGGHDLRRLVTEGKQAKERMVLANLRLVAAIARMHEGRGLELDDLVQEGSIGLIRAVERFDYTLGTKFSTYATWWIRRSILAAISDGARTIRVPRRVGEELGRLRAVSAGGQLPAEAMAEELGMPVDRVRHLLQLAEAPVSLDVLVPADDLGAPDLEPRAEQVSDGTEATTADRVVAGLRRADLAAAIASLGDEEATVLRLRFGLAADRPLRLREVARATGMPPEVVRQIEVRAIAKLRHPSRSRLLRG